jgi:SP family general alpha glucoside:H+ symporter-like MFS transporter
VYTSGMPGDVTHRRIEFLFGKIIVGISCGVLMSTCQTYISEISPKSLRGLLLGLYPFTLVSLPVMLRLDMLMKNNQSLGHLFAIAAVFAQIRNHTSSAYQIPFATQWIFSVIALAAYFALPESPVWLVANNRVEEAVTASHKLGLSGTTGSNNMVGDMQITMALENNHEESPTWKECFIGTNFRRTRIIIWLNILQQLVGIALLSNAAYFLQMAGMSATYSLMVNQVGVTANIVACIISWFSVRVYGRRQLILFSVILDAAVWLAMGISGLFNNSTAKW